MIELKEVTKTFKIKLTNKIWFNKYSTIKAIDNLSLNLKKGQIFSLLGPNGAGKTTLLKLVSGLLKPTSGSIIINNSTIEENKQNIGLMLGNSMLYHRLTGHNNLKFFAKLYQVKNYQERIKELANFFNLTKWLNNYVETYSNGMMSKLALARAIIHDPEILLLDEPTLGLDPIASNYVRNKIKELNKTTILTTHYLEEAKKLATRIAILDNGRIIEVKPQDMNKYFTKNV
ncbi:MAG: ABC transporter ATP-binding protein [Nanoarchaeota archaeon]